MEILAYPTVGSFVANDYRTATVFQKYGIDFCCKGGRTIDEVCEHKKISTDTLLNELNEVSNDTNKHLADFASWPLDLLVDYIEKRHHRFILETTPSLRQFLEKLCKVHGERHPELFKIREEFNASADELALHMEKEETILFPFVRKMVAAKNAHQKAEQSAFGTIQNPIQMMMHEHNVEGERFRKIATLSNNYTAPDDGCTTYKVAFALLKEFEADLHLHIHLENNILFPNAITMETSFI
jgi:regulator of cell morphogenesis and NO signaling